MRKTGPATKNLTEQLQETVRRQREEIEAATRDELQTLVSALRQSSSIALDGLKSDILSQLSVIQNEVTTRRKLMNEELAEIRKSPRRMILSSVAIAATITAIFWSGPPLWTMWQLGSVTVQSAENGTFLILPPTAQTGWTCGDNPCVKLKE